jgi:hypothetical protein
VVSVYQIPTQDTHRHDFFQVISPLKMGQSRQKR